MGVGGPFEKNADMDVLGRFSDFQYFRPPQNEKNADLNVTEDFKIFNILDPSLRKMQIWMLQIFRFSIFQTIQNEKNANLDVSEDFKIENFWVSPPKTQIWTSSLDKREPPHL